MKKRATKNEVIAFIAVMIALLAICNIADAQSNTWLITQDGQAEWDTTTVVRWQELDDTAAAIRADFPATGITPSDTATMLLPYLRKVDTTAMLLPYAHKDGTNATGTWPISITGTFTPRTIGTATGDVTSAGSSFNGSANNTNAYTLATVNSNVGTFGSATQSGVFTVNGKGLITAASNATITPAVGSITGFGTGVQTALGVNVGTAGAFVVNGGALGTPSSGTATNLTGTAPGLTAGNVTTNANLTGPITSVGNATSIASQTGTGTTFVMSAAPTLTGTTTAAAMNVGGGTANGALTATSTTDITLASTAHAVTLGGAASSTNMALGEYSTGVGIQSRNNGAIGVLHLNPLGGDVRVGADAPAGGFNFTVFQTGSGTADYAEIAARNGAGGVNDGFYMRVFGTAWTTAGNNFQDGASLLTATNLTGGLSFGTVASADVRLITNNAQRIVIAGATGNLTSTSEITSTGGKLGYSTGAGGTVVQGTSRTTTVVNNKLCGTITLFSAAQAANALVTFTLTNSFIAATDYLMVQHTSATDGGAWCISTVCGSGSATINIRNVSTGSITSATPLQFVVIKSVNN